MVTTSFLHLQFFLQALKGFSFIFSACSFVSLAHYNVSRQEHRPEWCTLLACNFSREFFAPLLWPRCRALVLLQLWTVGVKTRATRLNRHPLALEIHAELLLSIQSFFFPLFFPPIWTFSRLLEFHKVIGLPWEDRKASKGKKKMYPMLNQKQIKWTKSCWIKFKRSMSQKKEINSDLHGKMTTNIFHFPSDDPDYPVFCLNSVPRLQTKPEKGRGFLSAFLFAFLRISFCRTAVFQPLEFLAPTNRFL